MKTDPLIQKLKYKSGQRAVVYNAEDDILRKFSGIKTETRFTGIFDFALVFVQNKDELDGIAHKSVSFLSADPVFWIAFPKKSSNIQTDLTMYKGWDTLKKQDMETASLVSINETWSAMRFRPKDLVCRSRDRKQSDDVSRFVDMKTRIITLPDELQAALRQSSKVKAFFETLSFFPPKGICRLDRDG